MRDYAYLECYEGNSMKFYEAIFNDDRSIDVHFGRIGTSGQSHHYDPNEKEFWRLVREKESKGYKLLRNTPNGRHLGFEQTQTTPKENREGMGYMFSLTTTQIKDAILYGFIETLEAYEGITVQEEAFDEAILDDSFPIFIYKRNEREQVIADIGNGDVLMAMRIDGTLHKIAREKLLEENQNRSFELGELHRFIRDKRKAGATTFKAVFA